MQGLLLCKSRRKLKMEETEQAPEEPDPTEPEPEPAPAAKKAKERDMIKEATEAAERLEEANERMQKLIERQERLAVKKAFGGKANAGETQEKTDPAKEYAKKALSGELN